MYPTITPRSPPSLASLTLLLALVACERGPTASTEEGAGQGAHLGAVDTAPYAPTEPLDLEAMKRAQASVALEVTESNIYPSCHVLLERQGAPLERLEVSDEAEHAELLWGCEVGAYARGERGERYYAYALPSEDKLRAGDQRVVAYGAAGELLWHHTIDRDSEALNFASSRRSSFIVELAPYLLCAGTRWDGSLEYLCAELKEGGRIAWQGKLPQWSGTDPIAHERSLTFATISSLLKIYPWEGVERESLALEGTGGYASIYSTDGEIYLFSPNRSPWKTLTGIDLASMKPRYERAIEEPFEARFAPSFAEHDLTLLRQGEMLVALKTSEGRELWRMALGQEAAPPVAASSELLYVLHRRAEGPNLIYALKPQSGQLAWYGEPPTGTLEIAYRGDALLLKSVRSVRRAWVDERAQEKPSKPSP